MKKHHSIHKMERRRRASCFSIALNGGISSGAFGFAAGSAVGLYQGATEAYALERQVNLQGDIVMTKN